MERKGIVTLKGKSVTLIGEEIKVGQEAPDFMVVDKDLNDVTFDKLKGKITLIASVPSLDTPICDLEIKRFNDEAGKISKDVKIVFISMDLPFAQKRFCQEYKIKNVKTFSDYNKADFGGKYGVLIKEIRLLSRAIFVVGADNKVKYADYVKEVAEQPNYDAALDAVKRLA